MVKIMEIRLPHYGRGYHLITQELLSRLPQLPENGLLNLFIKHTSAAVTINENADPDVRLDFAAFFDRIVPDGASYFKHIYEGDDDMSAHIKASLLGASLTIPIRGRALDLGTWQGIYLCEFRNGGGENLFCLLHFQHQELCLIYLTNRNGHPRPLFLCYAIYYRTGVMLLVFLHPSYYQPLF